MNDRLRQKIDADDLILCLCLQHARTVDIPMMAAACGFDAVYVDLEHTATSLETTSMLCAAAVSSGLISLVRLPSHDPHYMTRVLDTGAMGVIVPHIETREQAEHVVRACRFPPAGRRSISGPSPVTGYRQMSAAETVEYLNRQTIVVAMIEAPSAVEHASEIASVPGLDMLLIGSYDLTAEMGIMGRFEDERFAQALRTTADACREHDKVMGVAGIRDLVMLQELVDLGVRFISAGTDSGFFMQAASEHAKRIRSLVGP
jgi:2-keto-3-deoxy-L-rhamnonate aldolase RhmA